VSTKLILRDRNSLASFIIGPCPFVISGILLALSRLILDTLIFKNVTYICSPNPYVFFVPLIDTFTNENLYIQDGKKGGDGKTEIFVKNLSWNTDDTSLREYFGKYGNVTRVNILKSDGKSKGIGFVCFEKSSEAAAAMEDASKIEIDGRNISLNWANEKKEGGNDSRGGDRGGRDYGRSRDSGRDSRGDRDGGDRRERSRRRDDDGGEKHTIFVGNLGYKTSDRTIREFFRDCGHVVDVRVAKTDDGKSKGFCHVDFDSRDGLEKALSSKAGADLDGRQVKLDESKPRGSGGSGGGSRGGFRGGRGGGRGRGRGDRDGGYRRRDDDY